MLVNACRRLGNAEQLPWNRTDMVQKGSHSHRSSELQVQVHKGQPGVASPVCSRFAGDALLPVPVQQYTIP